MIETYQFFRQSLVEASNILKRLSERLYQHNQSGEQADIDSLQEILDSPLFHTLYNLQESFDLLKYEFEQGNSLVKNCSFDFDVQGHLQLLYDRINQQSKSSEFLLFFIICSFFSDLDRLADENIIRTIVLNKQTIDQSLGFDLIIVKHRLYPINGVFIKQIDANSLADL